MALAIMTHLPRERYKKPIIPVFRDLLEVSTLQTTILKSLWREGSMKNVFLSPVSKSDHLKLSTNYTCSIFLLPWYL